MSKDDDSPTITMRVEKGRLVPVSSFDLELVDQWYEGAVVSVTAVRTVIRPRERQYFAMLSKLLKEADTPWSNTLTAHEALKMLAGFVEPYKRRNGTWASHPRSISTFTDSELEEYFEIFCSIVEERFGIDPATLGKEATESSGVSTIHATGDGPGASPIPAGAGEPYSADTPSSAGSEADDALETTLRDTSSADDPAFTPAERGWLKQTARMLVGATAPGGDVGVLDTQVRAIKDHYTPSGVRPEAKAIASKIYKHCRTVCRDQDRLDKPWIAEIAQCKIEDSQTGGTLMSVLFTYKEKAKEARREVTYRQFVYSKQVGAGKMKEVEAKRKIAIMEQIADDYDALAIQEEAAGRLL